MQGSGYLLVGYHHVDAAFAIKLALDLKNMGVNVWLDRFDMTSEDDWIATSRSALSDCAVFLPVMSPDYVASRYGRHEVERAHGAGRVILPVLLRYVHASDWLVEVGYDHVDMTDWQSSTAYDKSLQTLRDRVEALGLVAVKQIVNPEVRYLNHIIAQVELQKAILAFVRLSYPKAEEQDEPEFRPEPLIEPTWGLNGPFLLDFGGDVRVISDLHAFFKGQHQHVLVSPNGFGKTTTLQRLLLDDAIQYRDEPRRSSIPLYVSLSDWQSDEPFQAFLQRHWWLKADISQWFSLDGLRLYLDDLDSLAGRSEQFEQLRQWLDQHRKTVRVVLACSDVAYYQSLNLSLPVVRIEGMTASRVEATINLVLGVQGAVIFWQKLFPESRWDWALRNPLYLQMLLFVYQHSPLADLPPSPAELISRWMRINWEREQILQHPNWVPLDEVIPALSDWAFDTIALGLEASSSPTQLSKYLPNEGVWYVMASAHIIRLETTGASFFHRAILNVLASRYLRQAGIHAYLSRPVSDENGQRIAQSWDAPLKMLMGFADDGEVFLRQIMDVDPFLAVMGLLEGAPASDFARNQAVIRLMDYSINQESALIGETIHLLNRLYDGDLVHYLLEFMRQGSWQERILATQFLRQQTIAIPPDLNSVLDAWSWNIDYDVLSHLRFMLEDALPVLIHQLANADWRHRRGAAWALGELGDKAAVVPLFEALEDGDTLVKREVISALRRIQDGAVAERLVTLLLDEDIGVRKMTAYAVADMGMTSIPALIRLLKSEDVNAKRVAIGVLGRIADATVIPDILSYLKHPNPEVRAVCVTALGNIGHPSVIQALAPLLQETSIPRWGTQSISELTQQALEKIGTEDAMYLIQRFLNKNTKTSGSASRAKEMLKQQSVRHRQDVLSAEAQQMATDDVQYESNNDNSSRMGTPTTDWLKDIESTDSSVRRQAIEMLSATGSREYLQIILNGLDDVDTQVRCASVKGLAHYAYEDALPGLEKALYDDDILVTGIAADILRQAGTLAVPVFRQALQSMSADVRAVAVESLGQIGDKDIVEDLRALSDDTEVPSFDQSASVGDKVTVALRALGAPIEKSRPVVKPQADESSTIANLHPHDIIISPEWEPIAPSGFETVLENEHNTLLPITSYEAQSSTLSDNILENTPDWQPIWRHLVGEDWHTQQQAAKDLIRLVKEADLTHDMRFLEHITSGLSHSDAMIRWVCVEALAWIGDVHTVPLLIQRLEDRSWTVRVAIVRTLAKIGHSTAVPALIGLLKDEHELVREVAAHALGEFQAQSAVPDLLALLDDKGFVARAAVEALGEIGSQEVVPQLLSMLQLSDEQLKWTIIEALGKIRDPQAVSHLIPYLDVNYVPLWDNTGDETLPKMTALALERIGTQEAKNALNVWRNQRK